MSDTSLSPARPVSLFTIVLLLGVFSAFLFFVRHYYSPAPQAAFNSAPENLPKELEWRATSAARRQALLEMRTKETEQASAYAWVDQPAGVVQLPLERAMELTVQDYRAKK